MAGRNGPATYRPMPKVSVGRSELERSREERQSKTRQRETGRGSYDIRKPKPHGHTRGKGSNWLPSRLRLLLGLQVRAWPGHSKASFSLTIYAGTIWSGGRTIDQHRIRYPPHPPIRTVERGSSSFRRYATLRRLRP